MTRLVVGEWTGIRKLAQGTWEVWQAGRTAEPSHLACLRLAVTLPTDEAFETAFRRRINTLKKLRHDRILGVLDGGAVDGRVWYASEFSEAPTLADHVRAGRKFSLDEVLWIGSQAAHALSHAHRRGILHLAVRPEACHYDPATQEVRIGGFGIHELILKQKDTVPGQPVWISPEQAVGKSPGKASDYYLLGGVMYLILTGRPLFSCENGMEWINRHATALPESPIHLVADLPEEVDSLILRMLAKDPARRLASGSMIVGEIDAIRSRLERRGRLAPRPATVAINQKDGLKAAPMRVSVEDPEDAPVERETAPLSWLSRLLSASQWSRRARTIGLAFALTAIVALLAWAFVGSVPADAEDMVARARTLMASGEPADWERAWNDHLEPLSRKYPGRYAAEVREGRHRAEALGDLRRAVAGGLLFQWDSEAERFYIEGVRLCQSGNFAAAREIWEASLTVFADKPEAAIWLKLTRQALEIVRPGESRPIDRTPARNEVRDSVTKECDRLRADGQADRADRLMRSLDTLYR